MDTDLVAPKPTKEFHEAYSEIYGKKKKDQKEIGLDLPPQKHTLDELDFPPIKAPGMDEPLKKEMPKAKAKKSGFFSNLFKKEKVDAKEQAELNTMDLPPPKVKEDHEMKELNLPPVKDEPIKLDLLEEPAPKEKTKLPKIELSKMKWKAPPKATKKKAKETPLPGQTKPGEKARVHDFLAEVKFGSAPVEEQAIILAGEKPKKKSFLDLFGKEKGAKQERTTIKEKYDIPHPSELPTEIPQLSELTEPLFKPEKEDMFEKQKMNLGARDMAQAYEKKHPHEPSGFGFLEDIHPPTKPKGLDLAAVDEEIPSAKKAKLLSKQDVKKHMKELKDMEKSLKQKHSMTRKEIKAYIKDMKKHEKKAHAALEEKLLKYTEQLTKEEKEIQSWKKKIEKQEERIDNKTKKMQEMEHALQIKQNEVAAFQPKLAELHQKQDALLKKEQEIKARQEDTHEVEIRLKAEETAILKSIKLLEDDKKLLDREQDAIIGATTKLQKERRKLNDKTREFKDIMKKLEDAEKALKRKSQLMNDRDAILRKKEKMIAEEVTRVQKLKKTAEKLKNVEETYERMKHRLRDAYKQHSYTYTKKAAVKKEPTIKPVPLESTFQIKHKERTKAAMGGDITNLITAAKQLILEKHYDDANNALNQLMSKYMQIPESNPRKKEIYYEILGLKNMLKLELLE